MLRYNFLDYKNLSDFYGIVSTMLRNTDEVNTKQAILRIGEGKDENHSPSIARTVKMIANLSRVYANNSDVSLVYDNGKTRFPPIPIYPLKNHSGVLKQITLRVKEVMNRPKKGEEKTKFQDLWPKNSIIFSKSFYTIPDHTQLRVTSCGMVSPVFSEPVAGKALPLFYLGGQENPGEAFERIESLYGYPVQDPENPGIAKLQTIGFSELQKKDPRFIQGVSDGFVGVPSEEVPWNLLQEVERGGIELSLEDGLVLKSYQMIPYGSSKDDVMISFKVRQ